MKKQLLASAAVLLSVAAMAPAALADVFVIEFVFKTVDISITETITKTKTVDIDVINDFVGSTAAEANSIYNQRNENNILVTNIPQTNPNALADITNSFNNNIGLVLWNQDVGVNANQINNVTAAVVAATDPTFFTESSTANVQVIDNNTAVTNGIFPFLTRSAVISNSVNSSTGVTMINQNAGFASNQLNNLTLAVGLGGAVAAMSEADLGQWNFQNSTTDIATNREASILASVNNNTGITAVNQNAGNFNNQATVISFAGGAQ